MNIISDLEWIAECPLCKRSLLSAPVEHKVGEWTVQECPKCQVGITNPRPAPADIGKYYRASFFSSRPDITYRQTWVEWRAGKMGLKGLLKALKGVLLSDVKFLHDYTLQEGRSSLWTPLRWVLALAYEPIQSMPPKSGSVLDIGFGRGEFLWRAKRLGWQCHGLEVSDTSVEWGRSMGFDARLFDGSFKTRSVYPDAHFDLISINHVLEHVYDPRLAIGECRRMLKPGGRLLIMVPNYECDDKRFVGEHWRMWYVPQHLFHYNFSNVEQLLMEQGFSEIGVRYKVWYNPVTERLTLKSLRGKADRDTYKKAVWRVRFGKRIDYIFGRMAAAQVGPGMAIEAVLK